MTANGKDPCPSCRGHGWTLRTLRRSPDDGGGTGERARLASWDLGRAAA